MFATGWQVVSTEETDDDAFSYDGVFWGRSRYTTWVIQYLNGDGNPCELVLYNYADFASQIERFLTDTITAYYTENYFGVYLSGVPLAGPSYVFAFIVNATVNVHRPENQEWLWDTQAYFQRLDTPQGAVPLSALTPANAFRLCPLQLAISVAIDDGDTALSDKTGLEQALRGQIETMLDAMNRFTSNTLNAEIRVFSDNGKADGRLYDGEKTWTWYIVHGEPRSAPEDLEQTGLLSSYHWFAKEVYSSYKGTFW